jgi:DNA-binding FrmR family transcriptional regulator
MKNTINLKSRISKIKGQIEGIERMIDEDRDSVDIVQQVVAVNSALKNLGIEILKDETATCVSDKKKFEVLLKNLFKLK